MEIKGIISGEEEEEEEEKEEEKGNEERNKTWKIEMIKSSERENRKRNIKDSIHYMYSQHKI